MTLAMHKQCDHSLPKKGSPSPIFLPPRMWPASTTSFIVTCSTVAGICAFRTAGTRPEIGPGYASRADTEITSSGRRAPPGCVPTERLHLRGGHVSARLSGTGDGVLQAGYRRQAARSRGLLQSGNTLSPEKQFPRRAAVPRADGTAPSELSGSVEQSWNGGRPGRSDGRGRSQLQTVSALKAGLCHRARESRKYLPATGRL